MTYFDVNFIEFDIIKEREKMFEIFKNGFSIKEQILYIIIFLVGIYIFGLVFYQDFNLLNWDKEFYGGAAVGSFIISLLVEMIDRI